MICHCRSCRLGVGSNGVPWATFAADCFRIEGEPLRRFASSPGVTRTFCGTCGASLTYENGKRPGEVDVTQGSLDDPDALGVRGRLFTEEAAAWERHAHTLPTLRDGKLDGPSFADDEAADRRG